MSVIAQSSVMSGAMKQSGDKSSFQWRWTQFLNSTKELSSFEVELIYFPIYWSLLKWKFGKLFKLSLAIISVICFFVYISPFNWSVSAIGRLVLIKILPVWNWIPLYNRRCLIEGFSKSSKSESSNYKSGLIDCSVCENIG